MPCKYASNKTGQSTGDIFDGLNTAFYYDLEASDIAHE